MSLFMSSCTKHISAPKMIPMIARMEIQGAAWAAASGKKGMAKRMKP